MREILFRGKRKCDNQWVFGNLVVGETDGWASIICKDDADNGQPFVENDVYPETVGEFTGRCAIDGTKIFEDDVIRHGTCAKSVVEFGGSKFWGHRVFKNKEFKTIDDYNNEEYMDLSEIAWGKPEVIGNIHDNPELLEVAK